MKKLAMVVGVLSVMLAASVSRADGYGMAGCGLGSLVFGAKDNTKGMQILAFTTNNILIPQSFAITSGTSNCTSGGVVQAEREQAAFAEVNFQDLKRDMASGGGEFLTSFSSLLGCEASAKTELFQMTQKKYETIFRSESTSPMEMLSAVKSEIKVEPKLASSCTDDRAIARALAKQAPATVASAPKAPAPKAAAPRVVASK